jgi:hypothetical protein
LTTIFNLWFASTFCCPQQVFIASLLFFCAEHLLICIPWSFVWNKNEVALLGTGIYLFIMCGLVSFFLIFLDLLSCWILVLANLMKDIPVAPKRALRAIRSHAMKRKSDEGVLRSISCYHT